MSPTSIPNAYSTPSWVQSLHYTLDPLGFMENAYRLCGDVFNAPVIGDHKQVLFINHPEAIQQLFTSDNKEIIAPSNPLLCPIVGDRSIFGMEGQRHRRERKLLMPPFHREQIPRYGELIVELTHQALRQILPGQTFNARELMQDISLDVILTVVFGIRKGDRFEQLKALIIELTDLFQNLWFGVALFQPSLQKDWGRYSPWGRLVATKSAMSDLLYAEIRERRQQFKSNSDDPPFEKTHDILSLLIQARDDAGAAMTDEELHDELLTLLLAGHETTATATAWALYWIHRDRQVYDALIAELRTLDAASNPMGVSQLPYLTAVCNEALRIYPVAILTVPREAIAPIKLMKYEIEPGTRLYGGIYLVHHRQDLYPNPKSFIPERFLKRQFSNFEFIPFGGGLRRCIGEVLAQFEMKLIIATLLQRASFRLVDTHEEVPKRRGVTLGPGRGVKLKMMGAAS